MNNGALIVYESVNLHHVTNVNIDGLMQERRNSNAIALELRLSSINPSICYINIFYPHAVCPCRGSRGILGWIKLELDLMATVHVFFYAKVEKKAAHKLFVNSVL